MALPKDTTETKRMQSAEKSIADSLAGIQAVSPQDPLQWQAGKEDSLNFFREFQCHLDYHTMEGKKAVTKATTSGKELQQWVFNKDNGRYVVNNIEGDWVVTKDDEQSWVVGMKEGPLRPGPIKVWLRN